MDITYRRMFRIIARHSYYQDERFDSLSLTPTESCVRRMRAGRCRLRDAPSAAELWYATIDGDAPALELDGGKPFSFWLTIDNPEFALFTDPAWDEDTFRDALLYFSNIDIQPENGGTNGTPGFSIPAAAGVRLEVRRRDSIMEFDTPQHVKTFTLEPWTSGSAVWRQPAPQGAFKRVALQFQDVPDGRYVLKRDGLKVQEFYLTDRPASQVFGVVDIYTGGVSQPPTGARTLIQGTVVTPADFFLRFQARKTTWHYVVVSATAAADFRNAKIDSSAPNVSFEAPETGIVRGHPAWTFRSEQAIALYEAPAAHHRYTLSPLFDGAMPEDPITLPYASPAATALRPTASGTHMISTIYVYV